MPSTWTYGSRLEGGGFVLVERLTRAEAEDALQRNGAGWIQRETVDVSTIVSSIPPAVPVCPVVSPAEFSWLAAAGLLT